MNCERLWENKRGIKKSDSGTGSHIMSSWSGVCQGIGESVVKCRELWEIMGKHERNREIGFKIGVCVYCSFALRPCLIDKLCLVSVVSNLFGNG